ncbi:cyclic AMP receptor protein [Bdellovibrio sp. qaytius]|nr:cyclic AMP receptor protein [Bdellovibrio sp. qaytius]
MVESALEDKRIFLVVTEDKAKMQSIATTIHAHINKATIFEAHDVHEASFKFRNMVPHVIILDLEVAKFSSAQLITDLMQGENNQFSVIFTAELPDNELFIDQVVSGQVQFLTNYKDEIWFNQCLTKALNRIGQEKKSEFILHFLTPNELLFKEGVPGESAYLVKRGELLASKRKNGVCIDLGKIKAGEFVGEMAHINQEPRSATVTAVTDCELIEIPFGSLDPILFSKPSWSKALFVTLSKRLKITNEKLSA